VDANRGVIAENFQQRKIGSLRCQSHLRTSQLVQVEDQGEAFQRRTSCRYKE